MSVASLRDVLCAVRCDDCNTCFTSPVMMSTNAFMYLKEYKDDKQSVTSPSERLVETKCICNCWMV